MSDETPKTEQVTEEEIRDAVKGLTKADLVKLAEERELEIPKKATNDDLTDAIVAHELAAQETEEVDYEQLSDEDLRKAAEERDFEVPEDATREQIIEALQAEDAVATDDDDNTDDPADADDADDADDSSDPEDSDSEPEDEEEESEIPDDCLQEDILHGKVLVPAGSPIPDDLTDEQIERFQRLGIVK